MLQSDMNFMLQFSNTFLHVHLLNNLLFVSHLSLMKDIEIEGNNPMERVSVNHDGNCRRVLVHELLFRLCLWDDVRLHAGQVAGMSLLCLNQLDVPTAPGRLTELKKISHPGTAGNLKTTIVLVGQSLPF